MLTGYGPFMNVPVNPSDTIGRQVSQMGVSGGQIEYHRLDVNHDAVDSFVRDMRANPPDVLLSLGYSAGGAQVEELPENRIGGGRQGETHPAGPIVAGEPPTLPTKLPVNDIEAALQRLPNRTIGTHISVGPTYRPDRSAYLCNYIDYLETDTFAAQPTTAGFVHVNNSTTPQEVQTLLQAIVNYQNASRGGCGMKIAKDKIVSFEYTLRDDAGEVIDASEGEPLEYLQGHKNIIDGLERELVGLQKGDKKKVTVKPEDGYGVVDPQRRFAVDRKHFGDDDIEPDMMVEMRSSDGDVMRARIVKAEGSKVHLDANHPLAGKTLHFDVEIKGVRDASKEEIEHGHPHGPDGHHHHGH